VADEPTNPTETDTKPGEPEQAPPNPTPPPAPAGAEPGRDDRNGYPEGTPLSEMTVEQREAYWRAMARKHEKMVKDRADYDDLKREAAEAKRLRKERETEAERQIREAREQARAEAFAELTPRLVMARFEAAAAGRIDPDRIAVLTEDIDLSRYLNDDGTVNVEKVTAKVDAWAPASERKPTTPKPDASQGARNTKTTGTDVGREMFNARRNKKPAA
jgi:hypothetical protein